MVVVGGLEVVSVSLFVVDSLLTAVDSVVVSSYSVDFSLLANPVVAVDVDTVISVDGVIATPRIRMNACYYRL